MKYFFALGNTPELSFLELTSVFQQVDFQTVTHTWVMSNMSDDFDAIQAMDVLGGTVKIASQVAQWSADITQDEIKQAIADYLISQAKDNKILFAFAQNQPIFELSTGDFKLLLKEAKVKSRYLDSTNQGVKAVIWLNKTNIVDLILVHDKEQIHLLKTEAMQDIDNWTNKDRNKPYADRKKGMIPPKVARMMVNLAMASYEASYKPKLLDPFCGTGTILMEAALLNCVPFGSDLDYKSVLGSIKNMDWLIEQYDLKKNYHFVRRDVSQIRPTDFPEKVDLIVTEPFLGRQTPQAKKLPNIFKGLEKLYLGAFSTWTKILADKARVVIVFPRVELSGKIYSLNNLIDKLASKGYTRQVAPIIYARKNALVQREIHIFDYKG